MYGLERSILDSDEASETGVMLGLTLTATSNTETYVVTNYNSTGEPERHAGQLDPRAGDVTLNMAIGYYTLNPRRSIASIPLWEM